MVGQNFRSIFTYYDRMLKVGRKSAIGRYHRPVVVQNAGVPIPKVEHGLYSNTHSGT